jgi:hypothetical protein
MIIELMLTKKHSENIMLGEYVCSCGNACGIRFSRISDRVMNERLPHGRYHWKSQLGLSDGQRIQSFILAGGPDSDGYIHLQNQEAHIIVSPNLRSIRKIVDTLEIKYGIGKSKGMDLVKMDSKTAMILPMINPVAGSYRYNFLSILANARRLKRGPWPPWLASRVDQLIS